MFIFWVGTPCTRGVDMGRGLAGAHAWRVEKDAAIDRDR